MRFPRFIVILVAAASAAAAASTAIVRAQQPAAAARVQVDGDDIGGVVRSAAGPEAGVWVIAETSDFPAKMRRIVVTDDQGRYLLPDLPKGRYQIWVRGYGLVDSAKVTAQPGRALNLTAVVAPNPRAAAEVYPASSWMSLMRIPPKDQFPMQITGAAAGRGRGGRGGAGAAGPQFIQSQEQWVNTVKGCIVCHQIGNKATRELSPRLGTFDSSAAAWERRLRSGQFSNMFATVSRLGSKEKGLAFYADWSDRIAAGEVPAAPPRPQGQERNVVLTVWDVSTPTAFIHDVVSATKFGANNNGYGPVYAADFHNDSLIALDPVKNTSELIPIPTLVDKSRIQTFTSQTVDLPSPTWGEEIIIQDHVAPDTPMIDRGGRVWVTGMTRPRDSQPSFCTDGAKNKFAKFFPIQQNARQTAVYDPKTKAFTPIDTCFMTHHVTVDNGDMVYYNGLGTTLGFINSKIYFETKNAEQAQGWCAAFADFDGDGKIDPAVDKLIQPVGIYSISVSPADGTIWAGSPSGAPGRLIRYSLGGNPPETCIAEVYEPPYNNPKAPGINGALPRGIDVDTNGVVWTSLASTGQMASFNRRKCTGPLTGAEALTGQHCPEGWKLYPFPAPNFQGLEQNMTTEWSYFNWVDRYNTLGLGPNTPIANGTNSDALFALNPATGTWVTLRVPYPLGFYQRGMDGRIDDAGAGWKGRGVWSGNGTRAVWHTEGGKGTPSQIVHFQVRPNPLAR